MADPPPASSKTLPTAHHLPPSSLHPSLPLVALSTPPPSSSPSPSPSPPPPSVSLYRTSPPTLELVWTWHPPAPPVDPSAPAGGGGGAAPAKKGLAAMRAAMMAKNKPGGGAGGGAAGGAGGGGGTGTVEQLRWSPDGQTLAVVVSPTPSTPGAPSALHLISLHTGLSLSPSPLPLSTPASKSRLTHLSWLPLPPSVFPPSSTAPTWSSRLIASLPSLPPLQAEGSSSSASAAGGPAAGLIGGGAHIGGSGGAGVFGAKQAMLERERAKEAQRALSLGSACPGGWPRLLDGAEGGDAGEAGEAGRRWTLLIVGDEGGRAHLFLDGSIPLGTVSLPSSSSLSVLSLLPSPSPPLLLSLLSPSPPSSSPLALPLPPSLPPFLRLSSLLRAHVEYAMSALQGARGEWDEARRVGKGWVQRVADVSRPHGVTTPPHTQLLSLLLTGRPSAPLLDFLSSKMNERGLVKWEGAMGAALERLRGVGWQGVTPALERVVVGVMEAEGWTRWPARASPHNLTNDARLALLRALALARETIAACARMQREVEEEERQFVHFARWVRYELDKLAHADSAGSSSTADARPLASFAPLPVAHYIRHCLPTLTPAASSTAPSSAASTTAAAMGASAGSKVAPFLNFGLATLPLDQNPELEKARRWVEAVVPPSAASVSAQSAEEEKDRADAARERLERRLRRVKEELRGQAQAEELERERERSARLSPSSAQGGVPPVPSSLYAPAAGPRPPPLPHPSTYFADSPGATSPPPPHSSFSAPAGAHIDPDLDAPPKPSSAPIIVTGDAQPVPEPTPSIPAMLHLLAALVGGVMDRAVRASIEGGSGADGVGGGAEVGEGVERRAGGEEGEWSVRASGGCEVWVKEGVVRFVRPSASSASSSPPLTFTHAAHALSTPDGARLRVVEFDFLPGSSDGDEGGGKEREEEEKVVVFALEVVKEGAPPTYSLSLLPFSSLSFAPSPPPSSPAFLPLPLSSALTSPLKPQYPPSAISLSRADDDRQQGIVRVRVAMLGGEGRRVEVVEVEFAGAGEVGGTGEGQEDVEMR